MALAYTNVAIVSVALLSISCARQRDIDRDRELGNRRDVQNVFYALAISTSENKSKPLQEILDILIVEQGKAFFLTKNEAAPIHVSIDREKWADALKHGTDIAVYTELRTETGDTVVIAKTFAGDSLRFLKKSALVGSGEFWTVDSPSVSP